MADHQGKSDSSGEHVVGEAVAIPIDANTRAVIKSGDSAKKRRDAQKARREKEEQEEKERKAREEKA